MTMDYGLLRHMSREDFDGQMLRLGFHAVRGGGRRWRAPGWVIDARWRKDRVGVYVTACDEALKHRATFDGCAIAQRWAGLTDGLAANHPAHRACRFTPTPGRAEALSLVTQHAFALWAASVLVRTLGSRSWHFKSVT